MAMRFRGKSRGTIEPIVFAKTLLNSRSPEAERPREHFPVLTCPLSIPSTKGPPMKPKHPMHGKPVTRRELFAQGVLTYGGYALMPSVLTMLSRKAEGAEIGCAPPESGTRMIPVIVLDLIGGANIAGTNVIVGDLGGQKSFLPDSGYATIGLAPEASPRVVTLNEQMGLAFHPNSRMLAGIKGFASDATLANVDGALFCGISDDDRRTNPLSPLYWLAGAGLSGDLVSLVGSQDGASAGNSKAPDASVNPANQPSRVTRAADARGLVNPGKLGTLLAQVGNTGPQDVQKVMNAIKSMSESRLKRFQQQDVPGQIQELIRCGYINASSYFEKFKPENLDPSVDPVYSNAQTRFNFANAEEATAGTIAKLVLDGYAGAGTIALGGFDYHTQSRAGQDSQDLLAGRMIGKILECAAAKSQPVMIYVYTDGGVSADGGATTDGFFRFNSDAGQCGATFSLVYKPAATKDQINRDARRQIGAFQGGGSVDTAASPIGTNVQNLTKAFVLNYLALHGRESELAKVVGDNPFGSGDDFAKHIAFKKIT